MRTPNDHGGAVRAGRGGCGRVAALCLSLVLVAACAKSSRRSEEEAPAEDCDAGGACGRTQDASPCAGNSCVVADAGREAGLDATSEAGRAVVDTHDGGDRDATASRTDADATPSGSEDCEGVPGGRANVDECGVCDADPDNDNASCTDCMGVLGGEAVVDACGLCNAGPTSSCTPIEPAARVVASDAGAELRFGQAVAVHDDTIAIGGDGVAYVFVRSGDAWIEQATIEAPEGTAGYDGTRVAVYGDTLAIGGGESVDVHVREGQDWSLQASLALPDVDSIFPGPSVALEGDTLLVGAPDEIGGGGKAFVFVRSGDVWSAPVDLQPERSYLENMGAAVALSGTIAAVGAPGYDDPSVGAVAVFEGSGLDWTWRDTVGVGQYDWFGSSVGLGTGILLVGFEAAWDSEPVRDAARLIEFGDDGGVAGDTYLPHHGLGATPADSAVAADGDRIVVAAGRGVDIWSRDNDAWVERHRLSLEAEPPQEGSFGNAVAIDGDTVVVAAYTETVEGADRQGAVYVFELPSDP